MTTTYQVIDLRGGVIDAKKQPVEGVRSAEAAVAQALGLDVVRSGAKKDLVARVYWQTPGHPVSMVRFYTRLDPERRHQQPTTVANFVA